MQLLFKRNQTKSNTGRAKFTLWSKVELDEGETAVIRRYGLDHAVLVEAIQPGLLRMAILVGLVAFVVGGMVIVSMIGMLLGFWLAVGAGIAAGYFYYDKQRETVYVRDLMHGRYFSCRSVIELARKEAWLGTIVAYLRQVMESAKHWDGTEAVPIPVLSKDDAKELIVRGL